MSAVHSALDAGGLDAMTADAWKFVGAVARANDMDAGAIVMGADSGTAPAVIMLRLPPGGVLDRHAHGCHRVEVVVAGSIRLADGRVLTPGHVMVTAPGEFYGPHTAGPDGCLTAEVFSTTAGFAPVPDPNDPEAVARAERAIARLVREHDDVS